MTDDVVIQVNNVSKKFKSQVVLKDITLQCRKGRIYGFVMYMWVTLCRCRRDQSQRRKNWT